MLGWLSSNREHDSQPLHLASHLKIVFWWLILFITDANKRALWLWLWLWLRVQTNNVPLATVVITTLFLLWKLLAPHTMQIAVQIALFYYSSYAYTEACVHTPQQSGQVRWTSWSWFQLYQLRPFKSICSLFFNNRNYDKRLNVYKNTVFIAERMAGQIKLTTPLTRVLCDLLEWYSSSASSTIVVNVNVVSWNSCCLMDHTQHNQSSISVYSLVIFCHLIYIQTFCSTVTTLLTTVELLSNSIFNNKRTEWPLTVLCSVTMQQYIKHKIERIRIYKLKHTYAKFNLHCYIRRLFVKLALKLLIDWKLIFPAGIVFQARTTL